MTDITIQIGLNKGISLQDYHGHKESYSKSDLSNFGKTPLYCRTQHHKTEENKKDIFELGTAAHAAILEGLDTYWARVAIPPDEVLGKNGARSTKAYKAWAIDHAHKTILTADQARAVEKIYHSVMAKSTMRKLLTGGIAEMSCFWIEEINGHRIMLKCRPDYLPANVIVTDLKTTGDIYSFDRTATKLKYHWSAWLTCRGLTHITGAHHNQYYFAVVETVEPFDCQVVQVMPEHFQLAEYEIMEELLPRLAACDRDNVWPGLLDEIVALQMPTWAFKHARHILEQAA